jgi:hypothetical protein
MLNNNLTKSLFAAALVLTLGAASGAQAKDIVKQARANDVADKYVLTDEGTLYRTVNGRRCDVTTNVDNFKISQHPNDRAMVYFKKNGDLYVLGRSTPSYGCPKANTKVLMENVKKYSVTSNTQTTIVNVALSKSGKFVAWDNVAPVLTTPYDVIADDYQMNQNFGADGKPFSSYVAFVHTARGGAIMKVKGINPEGSKWDTSRYYTSIRDFKEANGLAAELE